MNTAEIQNVALITSPNNDAVVPIRYTKDTDFYVQIGRFKKGSYKTRYHIVGNINQAVMYYNAINVGHGYKKRLIAPSLQHPTIARASS